MTEEEIDQMNKARVDAGIQLKRPISQSDYIRMAIATYNMAVQIGPAFEKDKKND